MMGLHSRRRFLTALGVGLGSMGLSRSGFAGDFPAHERKKSPPLHFFGVYTPHGCAYEYFPPEGNFDFSYEHAVLAPFEDESRFGRKYKEKLIVLDGVDLSAGLLTGTVGHDAPRVILTGSGADGTNPSIDQYLAVEAGLGADTLYTSLVLGIGNDQSGPGNNISYARGGTELPKTIDPRVLFADLFGTPLTGKSKQTLQAERSLGLSALDFTRRDLKLLKRHAPASERTKIEHHETALRDIEKRLTQPPPKCDPPPEPRVFPRLASYGGGEPYLDEIANVMIDLSVRAHACDLTRFSTLFLNDLSRTPQRGALPADIHQGVAHTYQARTEKSPGRPESWQALAFQNRHSYSKVARLAQRLDDAGLLDDSVVYASSDLGDPARHSSRHVPSLLLGGAGGMWAPGKYVRFDPNDPIPNNRILVSIAQAFGVETDRFGFSSSSAVVTGHITDKLAEPVTRVSSQSSDTADL